MVARPRWEVGIFVAGVREVAVEVSERGLELLVLLLHSVEDVDLLISGILQDNLQLVHWDKSWNCVHSGGWDCSS